MAAEGIPVLDLYNVSRGLVAEHASPTDVHYTAAGYAAAFATYNTEYASYSLQLKAEVAGVTTLTITDDGTTNTKIDNVANFTGGAASTEGIELAPGETLVPGSVTTVAAGTSLISCTITSKTAIDASVTLTVS